MDLRQLVEVAVDKSAARKALDAVFAEFKAAERLYRDDIYDPDSDFAQPQPNSLSYHFRDWGTWEVPYDAEDDGDYDWKQLSDASSKKADAIIKKANATYKSQGLKFALRGSEKNWLELEVSW